MSSTSQRGGAGRTASVHPQGPGDLTVQQVLDTLALAIRLRPADYLSIVEPSIHREALLRRLTLLEPGAFRIESAGTDVSDLVVANLDLVDNELTMLVVVALESSPALSALLAEAVAALEGRFSRPVLASVVYVNGLIEHSYEAHHHPPLRVFAAGMGLLARFPRYLRPEPLHALLALYMPADDRAAADLECFRCLNAARLSLAELQTLRRLALELCGLRGVVRGS